MHPESRLLLFELDPELSQHLEEQFRGDSRVSVFNADAARLAIELAELGHAHCDYVVSGIPFSILESNKKRELLQSTHAVLAPTATSAFIIYQVTNELVNHCRHFSRIESEYCLQNIPPMFVTKFYKTANGHGKVRLNGNHGLNGKAAAAPVEHIPVAATRAN